MEEIKNTKEYTIFKKRSGRYAVVDAQGKPVNGKHKSEILFAEKLIKTPPPQTEAPVVQAPVAEDTPAAEEKEAS